MGTENEVLSQVLERALSLISMMLNQAFPELSVLKKERQDGKT